MVVERDGSVSKSVGTDGGSRKGGKEEEEKKEEEKGKERGSKGQLDRLGLGNGMDGWMDGGISGAKPRE